MGSLVEDVGLRLGRGDEVWSCWMMLWAWRWEGGDGFELGENARGRKESQSWEGDREG